MFRHIVQYVISALGVWQREALHAWRGSADAVRATTPSARHRALVVTCAAVRRGSAGSCYGADRTGRVRVCG